MGLQRHPNRNEKVDDTFPRMRQREIEKIQGLNRLAFHGFGEDQTKWVQVVSVYHHTRTGARGSEPKRDTVTGIRTLRKARR